MSDIKPWWQSRTIWSALVLLAVQGARIGGLADVDDATQDRIVSWVMDAVSIVAGLGVLYGRTTATKEIA